MTYKLEPIVGKIRSPIKIRLPDGSSRSYDSGDEAASAVFDRHYVVDSMTAAGSVVEIEMAEVRMPAGSTWVGEEQSFF